MYGLTNRYLHALFFITLILIASCESQTSRFNKIKNTDTPEALEGFIKKYPKGRYISEATILLAELRGFEDAKKKNTINEYMSFLIKYPKSKFVSDIDKRMKGVQNVIGVIIDIDYLWDKDVTTAQKVTNEILNYLNDALLVDPRFKLKLITSGKDRVNVWGILKINYEEKKGTHYFPYGVGTDVYLNLSLSNKNKIKTTWDNVSLSGSPAPIYSDVHFYSGANWLRGAAIEELWSKLPVFRVLTHINSSREHPDLTPIENQIYTKYLIYLFESIYPPIPDLPPGSPPMAPVPDRSLFPVAGKSIIKILGESRDKKSIDFLINVQKGQGRIWGGDEENKLREAAKEALRKIRSSRVVEP